MTRNDELAAQERHTIEVDLTLEELEAVKAAVAQYPGHVIARGPTFVDAHVRFNEACSEFDPSHPCGFCDSRGFYFNDKGFDPQWYGGKPELPDWDNGGFSRCNCRHSEDVDYNAIDDHPEMIARRL